LVSAQTYNKCIPELIEQLLTKEVFKNSKNIAVCTNSKHDFGAALVKNGFNVTVFNQSTTFIRAIKSKKLQFDTVILRWGDRDTWRALQVLPKFTKLISLYSPLFHTGLDHELNKKFFVNFIGTTPTYTENGRCNIAWDNRAFIYDFDMH